MSRSSRPALPPLTRRTLIPLGGLAAAAPVVHGRRAAAQATPVPAGDAVTPSITVTGVGVVTVTPDVADVTVGVSTVDDDLADAQAETNRVAAAILEVAADNGVDDADVQTVSYGVSVREEYDDDGNPTGRRSFEVANLVTIRLRDIDAAGDVLGQLVDAGANQVYGISLSAADPGPASAQARTAAAADARARAEAYAAGLGVEITGLLALEELSAPQPAAREVSTADAAQAPSASGPVPVAAGSTAVTVSVQVVFAVA